MADTLPRRRRRLAFALYLGGTLAALAGCGPAGPANLVPVAGTVTYDGRPLTKGTVSFRPDAGAGNTTPYEPAGTVDEQGHYTLVTAGKPGAPPGHYKVTVAAEELDPNNPSAAPKSLIPVKYGRVTSSGLTIDVVEHPAPGAYDIKLAR
jgi:hypothetical protein